MSLSQALNQFAQNLGRYHIVAVVKIVFTSNQKYPRDAQSIRACTKYQTAPLPV